MLTSLAGDLYNSVKGYMDSAKKWAEEICDIIEPWIQNPDHKPDDRFLDLAMRLFGANDVSTMTNLYSTFLPAPLWLHTVHAYRHVG